MYPHVYDFIVAVGHISHVGVRVTVNDVGCAIADTGVRYSILVWIITWT